MINVTPQMIKRQHKRTRTSKAVNKSLSITTFFNHSPDTCAHNPHTTYTHDITIPDQLLKDEVKFVNIKHPEPTFLGKHTDNDHTHNHHTTYRRTITHYFKTTPNNRRTIPNTFTLQNIPKRYIQDHVPHTYQLNLEHYRTSHRNFNRHSVHTEFT